jgi:hypothetical protein
MSVVTSPDTYDIFLGMHENACYNGFLSFDLLCATLQPGQSAPEMAAAAAAAAVVREAAASAVMDVLDAGESEEEKTTKLALAKEDKMRKVIRSVQL